MILSRFRHDRHIRDRHDQAAAPGDQLTNVVAIVHALLLRCPAGTELIIDGTGVGKPVADIFKWHGVTPWCVTATAGIEQTIDAANLSASNIRLRVT